MMHDLWLYISMFLSVYSLFVLLIITIGYYMQRRKEASFEIESGISAKDVTVLIPFRNEEQRILPLLESILRLEVQPGRFVFIDDHSTDATVELIEQKLGGKSFEVLSLPEGKQGKKLALRHAIEQIKTEYVLTMDADVAIPATYFSTLEKLGEADMYVLPAIMQPTNPLEYIFEIDLVLVNAANTGLAGLSRPIMASGANLLYKKSTFDRVDDYASHAHAASGDDTYLLRDFREKGCDVRLCSNPEIAVFTETPKSFKEFIDQRLRWIGKTPDIKDNLSTTLAVVQSMLTFGFVAICVLLAIIGYWKGLLAFYLIKTTIDGLLFLPYFNRIRRLTTWLFIPIYEVLFPIYSFIILVLMPFYKPKWKGRAIYENE